MGTIYPNANSRCFSNERASSTARCLITPEATVQTLSQRVNIMGQVLLVASYVFGAVGFILMTSVFFTVKNDRQA
jgi:hypothetical protein